MRFQNILFFSETIAHIWTHWLQLHERRVSCDCSWNQWRVCHQTSKSLVRKKITFQNMIRQKILMSNWIPFFDRGPKNGGLTTFKSFALKKMYNELNYINNLKDRWQHIFGNRRGVTNFSMQTWRFEKICFFLSLCYV